MIAVFPAPGAPVMTNLLMSFPSSVGASRLKRDQIAERGARMASRDDREYREYLSEEHRRQARMAGEVVHFQPRHATSL